MHRTKLVVSSGEVGKTASASFRAHNVNNDGILRWESGEIQSFIKDTFERLGLTAPSTAEIHFTFQKFDSDGSGDMVLDEGIHFVESLCHSLSQISLADQASSCLAGHAMVVYSTQRAGHQCNSCYATFGQHIGMWACHSCKYYLCIECSKIRRTKATLPQY